jgi:hypothetical protein
MAAKLYYPVSFAALCLSLYLFVNSFLDHTPMTKIKSNSSVDVCAFHTLCHEGWFVDHSCSSVIPDN